MVPGDAARDDIPKTLIHGTAVCLSGNAALIIGPSGSGKSGLALQLLALGCELICDDQCELRDLGGIIECRKPEALPNLIEARQVGLLQVPSTARAPLAVVIDLSEIETERLPEPRHFEIFDQSITMFQKSLHEHFPAAIFLYLKSLETTRD